MIVSSVVDQKMTNIVLSGEKGQIAWDLQVTLATQLDRDIGRLYDLSAAGETSWHDFASEIVIQYRGLDFDRHLAVEWILSIATSEYPTPA